jgi:hypothetical protein
MPSEIRPGTARPAGSAADRRHAAILAVLDRLLHDAAFRATFLAQGPQAEALGLADDIRPAFALVDPHELALVGRRIRSGVQRGGAGTGPGLEQLFPGTLAALRESTGHPLSRLIEEFIASPEFQQFRDVPFAPQGRGRLLPECFHRYLAGRPPLDPTGSVEPLAYHEAATALAQAVAAGAEATFDLGLPGARRHRGVWCAHRDYAGVPPQWELAPTLYLARPGRCVVGRAGRATFDTVVAVLAGQAGHLPDDLATRTHRRLQDWGML